MFLKFSRWQLLTLLRLNLLDVLYYTLNPLPSTSCVCRHKFQRNSLSHPQNSNVFYGRPLNFREVSTISMNDPHCKPLLSIKLSIKLSQQHQHTWQSFCCPSTAIHRFSTKSIPIGTSHPAGSPHASAAQRHIYIMASRLGHATHITDPPPPINPTIDKSITNIDLRIASSAAMHAHCIRNYTRSMTRSARCKLRERAFPPVSRRGSLIYLSVVFRRLSNAIAYTLL